MYEVAAVDAEVPTLMFDADLTPPDELHESTHGGGHGGTLFEVTYIDTDHPPLLLDTLPELSEISLSVPLADAVRVIHQ